MSSLIELNNLTIEKFGEYVHSLNHKELLQLKNTASDTYYNSGENGLSDYKYDMIIELLGYDSLGAKVSDDSNKIKLPYFMGSLNKIKHGQTRELEKWIDKNKCDSYIIENKIDGVSCLLISKNKKISLYTRGDGIIGSDISSLCVHIKNIPKNIENVIIRGELVISRKIFREEFADDFANPRNMVSGIIGTKGISKNIDKIRFVSYEIIDENLTPEEQLLKLKSLNFEVVKYSICKNLENDELDLLLRNEKNTSKYDIDGIVIQSNEKYERNTSGNPSYAFAFKNLADIVTSTVLLVIWNITKHGLVKPRISIEPVNVNGVVVSYTTGFNAKYICENKIGKGAIIEITRSGDVIPHIVGIVKQAKEVEMPAFSYRWNDTHVDIVKTGDDNEKNAKIIGSFFSAIDVKFIGEKTIKKLIESEFDTIEKIVKAKIDELAIVKGLGPTIAKKIHNNIQEGLRNASTAKILSGSCVFGFGLGEKKIDALLSAIPNLLKNENDKLEEQIAKVKGFSEITAKRIVENLSEAQMFIDNLSIKLPEKTTTESIVIKSNRLENVRVVFSGLRNKQLEARIINAGGKVTSSVSSKTTCLISKDTDTRTEKVFLAMENGIDIFTVEEFEKKYFA